MDRIYVKAHNKTPVAQLGLDLWCQHVVRRASIQARMTSILLEMIQHERAGEVVARSLIRETTQVCLYHTLPRRLPVFPKSMLNAVLSTPTDLGLRLFPPFLISNLPKEASQLLPMIALHSSESFDQLIHNLTILLRYTDAHAPWTARLHG